MYVEGKRFGKRTSVARPYSLGVDISSAVVHGVGALLAIAAIVLCVVKGVSDGGGQLLLFALLYSVTQFLWLVFSVLHHAIQPDGARRVMGILNHGFSRLFCAAYVTPFLLLVAPGVVGIGLSVVAWVIAVAGVVTESTWVRCPAWLISASVGVPALFLLGFAPALVMGMPAPQGVLLMVGGGCCVLGFVMSLLGSKLSALHTVSHVLTLAGAIFLFFPFYLVIL